VPIDEAAANRPAPILDHHDDVGDIQRQQQALEIVAVLLDAVAAILRRLALAESHVVRDHHPSMAAQPRDEVSVEIAPGRFAVHADEYLTAVARLIDVVLSETVAFEKTWLIGPGTLTSTGILPFGLRRRKSGWRVSPASNLTGSRT